MMWMWMGAAATCLALVAAVGASTNVSASKPVWFYRALRYTMSPEARRMFGGTPVFGDKWPAACVLLDGRLSVRCSCSAVTKRFVLTAAHCVTPNVHYVAHSPAADDQLAVKNLFRHKQFTAVQRDEGQGLDVVELRNDVGLVETQQDVTWHVQPILHNVRDLEDLRHRGVFVQIYGYGQADSALSTRRSPGSEQLYTTELSLAACARATWTRCACGAARGSGVCAGDSGGPVVFEGNQVGVTSMGPVACGQGQMPDDLATSVFTSVAPYMDLISSTMTQPEGRHMTRFRPRMAAAPRPAPPALLPLALLLGSVVR